MPTAAPLPPQVTSATTVQRTAKIWPVGSMIYDSNLGSLFVGDGVTHGGDAASPSLFITNIFTAPQTLPVQDHGGQVYNVKAYGAKGDSKMVTDGTISSTINPTHLTSMTANFVAADVGKLIAVKGAGTAGDYLGTTIASILSNTVAVLSAPAVTTATGVAVGYGTDDTSAINAATTAASVNGGIVEFPPASYLTTSPLQLPSNVVFKGAGNKSIIQPHLVFSASGGSAIVEAIGTSTLSSNGGLRDIVLDTRGSYRTAANFIAYQLILSNAERYHAHGVTFRDHGYGTLPTDLPSDPCLLIIAKDALNDVAQTVGGQTLFPTAVIGPSQYHHITDCIFEGTSTSQFAIRLLTDWVKLRPPLSFVNRVQGCVIDRCIFTGSYGWNVVELAGGGTHGNVAAYNRFKGNFATLTCLDLDKGCNYNVYIGNVIEGATKPSYYIGNPNTRLAVIDDHGIPASDPGGPYLSEANRIISNIIGPIDNTASIDPFEAAISVASSIRTLVSGNAISSVNLTVGNGNGILLSDCSQATISNNTISGVQLGIRSDGSATSRYKLIIADNEIESNDYGIWLGGGAPGTGNAPKGAVVRGNRIGCPAGGLFPCITVSAEVSGVLVEGNTTIGGDCGILSASNGASILDNIIRDPRSAGIRVSGYSIIDGTQTYNVSPGNDLLWTGTASPSVFLVLGTNHFTTSQSVTSSYVMKIIDEQIYADASSGPITITLIDSQIVHKKSVKIVKTDSSANAVTVVSVNAQTIDGASSISITQQWQATIISTYGTGWFVDSGGAAQWLVTTSVKTGAYIAKPADFIPVDASAASVPITLPTAPADKTRIAAKLINVSGAFVCTLTTGGTDVFNVTGGVTTKILSLLNQAITIQYTAATKIWYVMSDDIPLAQLDARYAQLVVGNTFLATQTFKSDGTHDIIDLQDSGGITRSSFDPLGFGFPFNATFGLSITPPGGVAVPLAAGTDQTNHYIVPRASKIVKCYAEAKTGPTGAALVLDIYKSTDGGATWGSIWTTIANRVQIAAGTKTGTQTAFDVTSVAEGDLLRIDVVSVGSTIPGNDVTVKLFMLGRNLA